MSAPRAAGASRAASAPSGLGTATTGRLDLAYARSAERPEIWIHLRPRAEVEAELAASAARGGPLAGMLLAVKDNIDVAGLRTTAGAPSYAYLPAADAPAVARLRAAGAVVLGKTNLDQFATGLVGTRSPHGAVRNAWDPARISGGSSSGSAVAVALGIADLALGTDTAGSGRVPAALNGVVGVKPTRGLVPVSGVVPACYTLDCVTVFARSLGLARQAAEVMEGPSPDDPLSRTGDQRSLPARPRVAVPSELGELAAGWPEAFAAAVRQMRSIGAEIVEVDISPLLEAARLLYEGAFVAERYDAVGAHVEKDDPDLDPTVKAIILAGRDKTAADWARDAARLAALGAEGRRALEGTDALLTPTTTWHPTLEQVAADPVGANARMGRFTNFANLLDYAALAVPAGLAGGLPFGVMLTAPAFCDRILAELAARFADAPREVFVVGAHLSGQPLNSQLVGHGGTLVGAAATAAAYRLHALATVPPKPGLVRAAVTGGAVTGGAAIEGEVWRLPAAGFGAFVAAIPAPMAIGTVELADGREVSGFLVEPYAVEGAPDISHHGGWRAYLRSRA